MTSSHTDISSMCLGCTELDVQDLPACIEIWILWTFQMWSEASGHTSPVSETFTGFISQFTLAKKTYQMLLLYYNIPKKHAATFMINALRYFILVLNYPFGCSSEPYTFWHEVSKWRHLPMTQLSMFNHSKI